MNHTPTPWKVFRAKNGVYIGVGDAEGQGIMDAGFGLWESGEIRDANAEFAVTAVNAYDKQRALIETLTAALDECEDYFDNRADADCDQDGFIPNKEMQRLTTVRDALAAAKKEGF